MAGSDRERDGEGELVRERLGKEIEERERI